MAPVTAEYLVWNLSMLQALGTTKTEKTRKTASGTCNLISPTRPVLHVLHFSNTHTVQIRCPTNTAPRSVPAPKFTDNLQRDAKCAAGAAAAAGGQKPLV
jgi:hypothetical protein